jgi:hypothetical protein
VTEKQAFFFFAFDNNTAHNDSSISMNEKGNKGRWLAFGLGGLQVLIGLCGVAGGFGLVTEPSGANLGFDVDLLSISPFSDYLIPGLILLVVIGLGSLAGGVLSILRYRYAGEIAAVSGSFLVIWITAQVWWIGYTIWLQPLFFGLGVVELVLGLLLRKRGRRVQANPM